MNRAERRRDARLHTAVRDVWLLAFYDEDQKLKGGCLVQATAVTSPKGIAEMFNDVARSGR